MSSSHPIHSVAVIGAGLAGISCAVALRKSISNVTVFESEPDAGGRMLTRQQGAFKYDSGAQYFTVRSDAFRQQVQAWQDQWLVDEWQAWLVDIQDGEALSREDGVTRYIGRPVMHSFIQDMCELCDIRYGTHIRKIQLLKKESRWQLFDKHRKKKGSFDAVIVAIPAPLAVPLLKAAPTLAKIADQVVMMPTWSLMLAFDRPLNLGFDGAYAVNDKLTWFARDNAKVERDAGPAKEIWVLHGSPEWSEANKKLPDRKVIRILSTAFADVTGQEIPEPCYAVAELWPYARPVNPLNSGCLYDDGLGIGACGDWCYGARVEGAYLSGISVAARILRNA